MNYPSTHRSLLERVRNGEEIAWSEFYDRYKGIIRSVGSLYHPGHLQVHVRKGPVD